MEQNLHVWNVIVMNLIRSLTWRSIFQITNCAKIHNLQNYNSRHALDLLLWELKLKQFKIKADFTWFFNNMRGSFSPQLPPLPHPPLRPKKKDVCLPFSDWPKILENLYEIAQILQFRNSYSIVCSSAHLSVSTLTCLTHF